MFILQFEHITQHTVAAETRRFWNGAVGDEVGHG